MKLNLEQFEKATLEINNELLEKIDYTILYSKNFIGL